jgi:hypothetical protein
MLIINWLQLLKLYEEEIKDVVSLVEQAEEVSNTRVSDYLRGLKSIAEVYSKVCPYIHPTIILGCIMKDLTMSPVAA